jgi:GntR family transcriptional repressor for pyruvate dehydrogenase complex
MERDIKQTDELGVLSGRWAALELIMATSIRPSKLADAIADHIQRLITEGALHPGDRLLSERELSEHLGVSRPSLRDALSKLVGLGLINVDAHGAHHISEVIGESIRDPLLLLLKTPNGLLNYLEFRSIVEGAASGLAAQRASDLDREAIKTHFERMVAAQRSDDAEKHAVADADFHMAIYEASHNLVFLHIMRSLEVVQRSDVSFNRKAIYDVHGKATVLFEHHRTIYDAIMSRDAEKARDAAQLHVNKLLETVRAAEEAEKRLQVSLRRLQKSDLVVPAKKKSKRRKASSSD